MTQDLVAYYAGQYTWPRFKALHSLSGGPVQARLLHFAVRNWLENSSMVIVDGSFFRITDRGREVLAAWIERRKQGGRNG